MQPLEGCKVSTIMVLSLLLCGMVATAPSSTTSDHSTDRENYGCPTGCHCNLAHTHKLLLHAKCNNTDGLLKITEDTKHPVHSIDLSYLGLTRIGRLLDILPDLTSVDLSHNELHDIGHMGKRIKKLNLKHNRLTSGKLNKLPPNLQILNLQHNDITTLPMNLTNLNSLMQLELSHNSINCSCETLEVRNWLQERNVYMEHAVVCSYPVEVRGKSWLQLKQTDICEKEKRIAHYYQPNIDENELMMGDEAVADSTEQDAIDDDELGKDFLPIDRKKREPKAEANEPIVPIDTVEGSGDSGDKPVELISGGSQPSSSLTHEELVNDETEEEGSGGGALIVPKISYPDENTVEDESEEDVDGDEASGFSAFSTPAIPIGLPISDNLDSAERRGEEEEVEVDRSEDRNDNPITFHGMGIFDPNTEDEPAQEDVIVPVDHKQLEGKAPSEVITEGPLDKEASGDESADIITASVAKRDDSNATYYLLGVIGLIVIGLILFVAIKRCKYNNNRAARDAESQRQTELLDMDKKMLGKPLHRGNGSEQSPLIGEKTKADEAQITNGNGKKAYDSNDLKDGAGQQPLLNGNGAAAKEVPTVNEPAQHEYYPVSPRYPTPQSPRASKYAQYPQGEPNNNEPDSAYSPSSPKMGQTGRYSPVYSPETGRVKIKLTETPKPKTPMLVTRSKSNAGDIITTPVNNNNNNEYPAVHLTATAGGH